MNDKKCTERLSTYVVCDYYKTGECKADKTCNSFYDKDIEPQEKAEAPEKIYAMPDLEGFWCDEKQLDNDIEYIRADIAKNKLDIAIEAIGENDLTICRLCRVINPQHKDCTKCGDREYLLKTLSQLKETGETPDDQEEISDDTRKAFEKWFPIQSNIYWSEKNNGYLPRYKQYQDRADSYGMALANFKSGYKAGRDSMKQQIEEYKQRIIYKNDVNKLDDRRIKELEQQIDQLQVKNKEECK